MASITVDILAKVVGYLDSLKALENAFAKVDPGSSIGKKLSAAIENAKKQVADLGKNMFPKASSDSLIDAIAERVNRVGAALLNVSNMFLSVDFGDLNLKALSPLISSAVSEMQLLLTAVDTTLNGGIRAAITNSSLLSNVFKDLGVNVKTLTADSGKLILAENLSKAELQAEKTSQAYTRALERAENALKKLTNILSNPYSLKKSELQSLFDLLSGFGGKDPTRILNEDKLRQIQELVKNVLTDFKGKGSENSLAALDLLNSFFGNIDPSITVDEFNLKFQEVCNKLSGMGFTPYTIKKLLGTTNGTNFFEEILNLDQSSQETKNKLQTFMSDLFTTLNFNDKLLKKINDLIDKGEFNLAVEEAKTIIKSGYDKIGKAEAEALKNFNNANTKLEAAQKAKDAAVTKRDELSGASLTYSEKESELRSQVASLLTRIGDLENTIKVLTGLELSKLQSGAAGAGLLAGKNAFPVSEALAYGKELTKINSALLFVGKLLGVTLRWFSVYAAVRMVSNAIKKIISNTKELDATITEIAIVTNMDQNQLWGQMPQYILMAKEYGASIAGAYKVSLLYYQQGLGLSDVMALSELTLKMARISGLDYALATDYMTNAVRSFKLEMTDAATVVDTYSAVAAASATSVSELATAMSKTASSALSVGSSLLNTTAMMAVMIEATRESPENIGSAMKSIISRYGELKENKTGIDEEGEEYSLNKVDTALLAVGISIHDAKGEFRDFDDVIFELADHWDEIDKNTQRYIATVMAGNRQQSRFLALVSSGERLKELSETAADSEDASLMQYLKTLDSIEYKSQLLQTSLLSLYANEGVLNLIKDTLDSITNIIDSFNNMSTAFNTPIAAIAKFGVLFANIASIVTLTFGLIKTGVAALIDAIRSSGIAKALQAADAEVAILKLADLEKMISMARAAEFRKLMAMPDADLAAILANLNKTMPFSSGDAAKGGFLGKLKSFKSTKGTAIAGLGLSVLGSALSMSAMGMSEDTQNEREKKAWTTAGGSILTGAGMGSMFGLPGMIIGGIGGLIAGIALAGLIAYEDADERAARLKKELETAKNENISKKSEFKSLKSTIDEYEKLKETHLDSKEAAEEYAEACNKIAEEHPDLVSGYDAEGNAILNLTAAYKELLAAKLDVSETEKAEADASINAAENAVKDADKKLGEANAARTAAIAGAGEDTNAYYDTLITASLRITADRLETWKLRGEDTYNAMNALWRATSSAESISTEDLAIIAGVFSQYNDWFKRNTSFLKEQGLEELIPFILTTDELLESGENEEMKAAADKRRAESAARSKYLIGAKSVVDSEILELLLADKVNNTTTSQYLSEFLNASVLMSREIAARAKAFKQIPENAEKSYFTGEDELFTEDFNEINKAISDFWGRSFKEQKDLLNNLITNLGDYTKEEASKILSGLELDEQEQVIADAVMQYYTNSLTSVSDVLDLTFSAQGKRDKTGKIGKAIAGLTMEDLKTRLASDAEWQSMSKEEKLAVLKSEAARTSFLQKLGENEKQAVSKFYNGILDSINADTISESTGEQITLAYVDTWKYLTNSENFEGQEELLLKAQALLKDSDFTKAEGILNFVDGLKDLGITISSINYDAIKFPPNFSATVQTFGNEMSTKLENFEKDMSSATKGMEFKKASEMASKLGININKFRLKGTKFYLDDYNLLEEYYFSERELSIADLKKELNRELQSVQALELTLGSKDLDYTLGDLLQSTEYTEEWQEQLTLLFKADDFTEYLTSDKVNLNPAVLQKEIEAFMKDETKEKDQQFLSWLENHNKELYESYVEASGDVLTSTMALALLSAGNLDAFIETTGAKKTAIDFYGRGGYTFAEALAEADSYNARLIERIATGDITNLEPELEQYGELIYNTFKDSKSSLISALLDSLEGGSTLILVTLKNKTLIEGLSERGFVTGDIEENSLVDIATEALMKDEEGFKAYLDSSDMTRKLRAEALKRWHDIHYPDPAAIAQKMMTSSDRLDFDTTTDLIESLREGQETDEAVAERIGLRKTEWGSIIENRDKYIDELKKKIDDDSIDESTKRELKAELASTERTRDTLTKIDTLKAISDLLKDTDTISEEARTAFEKAIGVDEAKKYFVDNGDGTHKLNVVQLRSDIENKIIDVGEAGQEQILESFAQLGDNAILASEEAVKLVTAGTNKLQDMQKVVNAFKGKYTLAELFTYDEILNAYTFNLAYLQEYLRIQAQDYAKAMNVSFDTALAQVLKLTLRTIASLVDIDSYLFASDGTNEQLKTLTLTALTNYELIDKYAEYRKLAIEIVDNDDTFDGLIDSPEGEARITSTMNDLAKAEAEATLTLLESGGPEAVSKILEIAKKQGKELTAEEMQKYYAPIADKYSNIANQVAELTVGQYIGKGDLRTLLVKAGAADSTTGLVTSISKMVSVYKEIYKTMEKDANATASQLNSVYARMLTAQELGDIDAISAMGDAMGMTYESLGEILGRSGKSLEEWINNEANLSMFERIGAGKIRIKDFTSFAAQMGWQPGSEEYTSAFKSYNDSLVELNLKTEKSILDEVKGLESAKVGDKLNLTLLYTELLKQFLALYVKKSITKAGTQKWELVDEVNPLKNLLIELGKYGASLVDGILTLKDNALMLNIATTLAEAAESVAPDMAAEFKDMAHNILSSFTTSITKGIEGGMTNVEAEDLLSVAKQLGLKNDLSFTLTGEGLLLAQGSAILLYRALSAVDALQGKIVFDKMRENLESTNVNYKNSTKLLARIQTLEKKAAAARKQYNKELSDAHKELLEAYQNELMLAEEIASVHATEKDSSWGFMSNEEATPGNFDNAFTYLDDVFSAALTLNSAADAGKILLLSLFPIIKHAGELADEAGDAIDFMGRKLTSADVADFYSQVMSVAEIDEKTGKMVLTAKKLKEVFGMDLGLGAGGLPIELMNDHLMYGLNGMTKERNQFYSDLGNMADYADKNIKKINEVFFGDTIDSKEILKMNKEFKESFLDLADGIETSEGNLGKLIRAGYEFSEGSDGYKSLLALIHLLEFNDYDAKNGNADIINHLGLAGMVGEKTIGDITYGISGNRIVTKRKGEKWVDEDGTEYDTSQKLFEAITQREVEEYTNEINAAGLEQNKIEGKAGTYTITNDADNVVISLDAGNKGKITASGKGVVDAQNKLYQLALDQGLVGTTPTGKTLSKNAWLIQEGLTKVGSYSGLKGQLRLSLIEAFLDAKKTTAEEILKEYSNLGRFEFAAKYGIDLELDEGESISLDVAKQIQDLIEADPIARSVTLGISKAFEGTGDGSVSKAISNSITTALESVSTGEDGAVSVKFKGEVVDGTIPPQEVKDEEKTVTYTPAKYTPPVIPDIYRTVHYTPDVEEPSGTSKGNSGGRLKSGGSTTGAMGTIGLANAKGTLMGELGPELVVSKGRYFVVGLSGPEMVNLADDAIVFNHLQTKSLLEKGTSSTRGHAITNEYNAVAYATGSRWGGLAHDFTGATGAESIKGAEGETYLVGDLANLLGKIAKRNKKTDKDDFKAFIKEFERWYNWLQKIAHLEKEISLEEAKRTRYASDFVRSGADIYKSQMKTLECLEKLIEVLKDLNKQRKEYNKTLRALLLNSAVGILYDIDEDLLPKYKDGQYEIMSDLLGKDITTNAGNHDVKDIYNTFKDWGLLPYMLHDKSGNKIDDTKDGFESTAVLAVVDLIEEQLGLLQDGHDKYYEGEEAIEGYLDSENEILKLIEDNQLALEEKVLKAIEDSRLRAIDDSKKERDAIEKANLKLIDGLNLQLENERTMRLNLKDADELSTLQRRLAILQRSGGSASEIASLELEITDKQYEKYFATQEQLIKAIEDASTAELERLDNLISIMEETLEYEKLHGLLWEQVYDVLQGSPEDIATFILLNTSEYWGKSRAELEASIREDFSIIDLYKKFVEDTPSADIKDLRTKVGKYIDDLLKEETSTEGNSEAANGQGTSGSNGGNEDGADNKGDSGNKKTQYEVMGMTFDSKEDAEAYLERWQKNANNKVTEASENYKADGSGSFYDALNNLAAWNNAVIKEISVDKNTKATGILDDEAKKIKSEKIAEAEKIKSETVAEEKTTKSGTTYYVYTDPNTGKTITGNAYYMKQKGVPGFSTGGLNNYTGLAVLHGTKDKPEAVLNAPLTKVLRDNILGNRPDSLVNLLKSYNEAYRGLSSATYDSISNETNSSIVIERAEVNLQIDELANDYDARRAANTVMDELLQIARKTSASNRVGRR